MRHVSKNGLWALVVEVVQALRAQVGSLAATYGLVVTACIGLHYLVGERWPLVALINNGLLWLTLLAFPALGMALLSGRYRLIWAAYALPGVLAFIVWYGPFFMPKAAAPAGAASGWVVVTSNLGSRTPVLRDQLTLLTEADVIGFQEYPRYPRQLGREWQQAQADNHMLYSRLPLAEDSVTDLTWHDSTRRDAVAETVAVRAQIDFGGQPVLVYSLHTPRPEIGLRPLGYEGDQRRMAIVAVLNDIARQTLPVIVLCDCNMTERTGDYMRMSAVLRDVWRERGVGLGLTAPAMGPPHGALLTLGRVDYIWVSEHFEVLSTRLLPSFSDHYMVEARLRLRD